MNKQREKTSNLLPFIPDGKFYFTKGVQSFRKRKFDSAFVWLQKAVESDPKNPLYNCQLSILHTEIGNYHTADELLNEVLENDEYVDCYYLLANNYAHLGLLNDSRKFATLYLEKAPDGYFSEEAQLLVELIDFELEDDDADEWLYSEEDDLLKYQETVFYFLENEEWEKALPILEDMHERFPDLQHVKHDYAQVLFRIGQKKEAIHLEEQMMQETDYTLHSMINLLQFYYDVDAKETYEKVRSILTNVHPFHGDQQIKLASAFAKTGNHEEAYRRFKIVDSYRAESHLSYYKWYSITAYHLGKEELASELWQEGCLMHRQLRNHRAPWHEL